MNADPAAASTLVDLVCAEARLHTSWDNVAPTSVAQRLVRCLLDGSTMDPMSLARMTDQELWSALEAATPTRVESRMLRYRLHRLRVVVDTGVAAPDDWQFALRKIYRSAPLVDGEPVGTAAPEQAARLQELDRLPTRFRMWWA